MLDTIDDWLRLAAARLHERAASLGALDRAIGDGDHGASMDRGFGVVLGSLDGSVPGDDDLMRTTARLRGVGRVLISAVGGAAGTLYGTALIRAAEALGTAQDRGSNERILTALEAAIRAIEQTGNAKPGEKTMLDALAPALVAARDRVAIGAATSDVLTAMADAGEAGAAATATMRATRGRASYLGDRSVGHQDPGATSAAILLRALADAHAQRG